MSIFIFFLHVIKEVLIVCLCVCVHVHMYVCMEVYTNKKHIYK